jgi:PRC-barrel domain
MEPTTYASRLRYLDADDVDDTVVDFDGLDVVGVDDEKLGEIDGFIVDAETARILYAVVDSGGWFSSQRLLLPIGHLGPIDRQAGQVRTDLPKDALSRYPPFDGDRFREFTDDELRTFETSAAAACCPGDAVLEGRWGYEERAHYRQPGWWQGERWRADRSASTAPAAAAPAHQAPARESYDRERIAARGGESSPHFDGRAQPGDVLGIETGGETTGIGDTGQDENERRRAAEKEARKG